MSSCYAGAAARGGSALFIDDWERRNHWAITYKITIGRQSTRGCGPRLCTVCPCPVMYSCTPLHATQWSSCRDRPCACVTKCSSSSSPEPLMPLPEPPILQIEAHLCVCGKRHTSKPDGGWAPQVAGMPQAAGKIKMEHQRHQSPITRSLHSVLTCGDGRWGRGC